MRALAVVVVMAGSARADVDVRDTAGEFPDTKLRFDGGIGIDVGGVTPARESHFVGGFRLETTARLDRLALALDYGWMGGDAGTAAMPPPSVADPMPVDPGTRWIAMRRVGAEARFAFSSWRGALRHKRTYAVYQFVRFDAWLGAGVTREDVYEHDAVSRDHESRTTTSLAIGLTQSAREPDSHNDAGMRLAVSRVPLPDGRIAHEVTFGWTFALGD